MKCEVILLDDMPIKTNYGGDEEPVEGEAALVCNDKELPRK